MEQYLRYTGSMLGLASGDALGTTNEFHPSGTFNPIDDMVGGGFQGLLPGYWTDDTAMALCLASSLVESNGFDPDDQMDRYVRWWKQGYLSSTGTCLDIGNTVRDSLTRYKRTGNPFAGSTDPQTAGNGSLMRLVPVPLFYVEDPKKAIFYAGESSRTTHGAQECIDACRYFAGLIIGALQGQAKDELLSDRFSPIPNLWVMEPLAPKIAEIASGSFKRKEPPEIVGGGYVVHCLEAALWAFSKTDDFRTGALLAVNLGYDADTTGAIYGQIAGAYYGKNGIPKAWISKLTKLELIVELSDKLHKHAFA